jgi:hypothetical protein
MQYGTLTSGLTLQHLPSLKFVYCIESEATALNLLDLPELRELYCQDNFAIPSLNLNGMNKLEKLDCSKNEITGNMYLSDKPNLNNARLHDNLLTAIFAKNGQPWNTLAISFHDNPGLNYICCDESQRNSSNGNGVHDRKQASF